MSNPETPEARTLLAPLLAEKCRGCGGEKQIFQHGATCGVILIDDGECHAPRQNECRYAPCPACQDASGYPTGLRFWQLSRVCGCRGKYNWCRKCRCFVPLDHPYKSHEIDEHHFCRSTQGRIPLEGLELRAAMEETLLTDGFILHASKNNFYYELPWTPNSDGRSSQPDRLTAAVLALAAKEQGHDMREV